jgi:hypothetical protein
VLRSQPVVPPHPSLTTARRPLLQAGKEDSQGERWKVGGPLMPDLDTALRHYPHSEVKLEGGMRHAVPTFLQQQGIDILVVGDQWPQSGLQLSSGAVRVRRECGRVARRVEWEWTACQACQAAQPAPRAAPTATSCQPHSTSVPSPASPCCACFAAPACSG